jgi:hypothetical protein
MHFKNKTSAILCLTAVVMLSGAPAALGGPTFILDGGWQATVVDPGTAFIVNDPPLPGPPDTPVIEISKDFVDPPGPAGAYPPINIVFQQIAPDASTSSRIIIADEVITNLTGTDWTDYHWQILDSGDAWFNVPLSSGWSVNPFTGPATFSDPNNIFGGDDDRATDIDVFGGPVFDNTSFNPGVLGGELVIDANLAGSATPVVFTFKQFPTPEPSTLALLAVGLLVFRRRQRS